ncbi:MAG: hypothetical protein ACTSQP_22110 [Promethearchaeota archaeon]
MGNIHKNGLHFFETTKSLINSTIYIFKNNSNMLKIGELNLIYNERGRAGISSPDMELMLDLSLKKIINLIKNKEISEPYRNLKIKKDIKTNIDLKLSCVVELEKGGYNAAENDLNQYNKRDKEFLIQIPIINILIDDDKKIISKKREKFILHKDIKLICIESSKFQEFT